MPRSKKCNSTIVKNYKRISMAIFVENAKRKERKIQLCYDEEEEEKTDNDDTILRANV